MGDCEFFVAIVSARSTNSQKLTKRGLFVHFRVTRVDRAFRFNQRIGDIIETDPLPDWIIYLRGARSSPTYRVSQSSG